MPTPPELAVAVQNPAPLSFIIRRATTNHVNFNISHPIHTQHHSLPTLLMSLLQCFGTLLCIDVSSSQLKATKINLIRFALAQGILLYPTTLSSESTPAEGPVKQMKFPEESKLFSILMEKLNQSNFTEALSLTIAIFSSPWRSQGSNLSSATLFPKI
jgi:hypothetical protein